MTQGVPLPLLSDLAGRLVERGSSTAILQLIIYCAIPTLIYIDASFHRIGSVLGEKKTSAAGIWAVCTMIPGLWVFAVMGYLFQRRALIEKAKVAPVELSIPHRIAVVGILIWANWWFLYGQFTGP